MFFHSIRFKVYRLAVVRQPFLFPPAPVPTKTQGKSEEQKEAGGEEKGEPNPNKSRKNKSRCNCVATASERSKGDSNPRYAFDVYTLSRRASSTTRASLHRVVSVKTVANIIHFSSSTKVFSKIVSPCDSLSPGKQLIKAPETTLPPTLTECRICFHTQPPSARRNRVRAEGYADRHATGVSTSCRVCPSTPAPYRRVG